MASSTTDSSPLQLTPTPPSTDDNDDFDLAWEESAHEGQRSIRLQPLAREREKREESAYSANDAGRDEDSDEEESGLISRAEEPQDFELYTPDEEKRVLRKLDRKLVLFMGLLYMLSFLDRSNIGNARIAGLTEDLSLTSDQYEWLLTAFYITYIAFEPLTLMYRLIPPHIYISACVFAWGLLASLQAIVSTFPLMLTLRAFLGIAEAAFGPGVPFYLSFFFRRDELAFRTGLFISAAPLSTSFASSLAWVITKLGEQGPVAPWRLLFLIEGAPSLFVAVWAWTFVPDGPGEAKWLDHREREVAVLRLRKEKDVTGLEREKEEELMAQGGRRRRGLNLREVVKTLKDPKAYLTALMFFSCNIAFSSMPVFLPTIIHSMGYDALTSQALSAPPYLLSFALVLATASLSDRTRRRGPLLIFHALLATAGYLFIAAAGHLHLSPLARYAGVYPATAGFFSAVTLIITWTLNNQASDSARGAGVALLNVVGQCGPLLGTRLYPDADAPYYVPGMLACAGFMALVAVLAVVLGVVLRRENKRLLREVREEGEGEGAVPLVEGVVGERRGPFLYML